VVLTRELIKCSGEDDIEDVSFDKYIRNILDYINANIKDDLSIETIAAKFFMSRYHLMHKFKQLTGYSVHSYILQKRLIRADMLIKNGMPATQACDQCGFNDYSNFVRSYKKMFGVSPRNRIK
jgi:AraC-like DNA-binding protein